MTIIQGIVLGIIQGLAEFLPISSSGHLVLLQRIFGIKEGALTFNIAVHLATLLAVFYVLRDDILAILKRPFSKLPILIVVGSIPTAIIGFLFNDFFETLFLTGSGLGFAFFLTGITLWLAEDVRRKNKNLEEMTPTDAVIIGIAQGVAIIPGVSRSGFTLAGSLIRGLNREFALKFSFLMSIPVILGAAAKDFYDIMKSGTSVIKGIELWPLITGMITAAIFGYLAIRFMLEKVSKVSLKIFSYYVFTLGTLIIIDQLFFGMFFDKIF